MLAKALVPRHLPVLDPEAIERLRTLAVDVGERAEEVLAELGRTFFTDAERRLGRLSAALRAGDAGAAADAVHALKGASATLGARRLSGFCAALEERARAGDLALLERAEPALREELEAALTALRSAALSGGRGGA